MRKIFLVLAGLFCLTAFSQTKTEIKVGKLPEFNSIEEMEAMGVYYSHGAYLQLKGTDDTIVHSGEDGTYMFINGKIEKFKEVEGEDKWEYKNSTYKIVLNVKRIEDPKTEEVFYKGEIIVTHLKTNTSKTMKVEGYLTL